MRSKVLVLDSSNALKRLAFEQDIDHAYDAGFDIEEAFIVSEEKIVFLLLSHRNVGDCGTGIVFGSTT